MTRDPAWGAAPSRGGASDTLMLIWKVVQANPGITREDLWERVENDIPAGHARRLFPRSRTIRNARRAVMNQTLTNMGRRGTVFSEGSGADRTFTAGREPAYRGNPDAIDETGTKAAEHMALADALRLLERKLASRPRPAPRQVLKLSAQDYDALVLVVGALRAQGRPLS